MIDLFFVVVPIFLVIVLGKIIQLNFVQDLQSWTSLNKINYWMLFPSLLFYSISTIDFSSVSLPEFSASILFGFFVAVLFSLFLGKVLKQPASILTSVMQGAGRHNTFIALAVVAQLYGADGTAIGIIATAILVPISNIVMVVSMSVLLNENGRTYKRAFLELVKNPIIVAIALGLLINFAGWSRDPVFYELTGVLGRAALPIVLLCIGAGLQFRGLRNQAVPCIISCVSKMVVFPGMTYLAALYLGLSENLTMIAVIFSIAPTSPASYSLAKQMGGDAPLIASIISLQTVLSVFAIPLSVALMQL
ncbi:AEC family transporter [Vibrio hannami]|uniref:AEC family transporter n=1 Tax=Vibrio hannami TaxID=2717094 RepID=UPI00240F5298|nr:AEC family transporter [Vibrio hannami]MDG3087903.1 AEC family transporter [Vibrio hannami]